MIAHRTWLAVKVEPAISPVEAGTAPSPRVNQVHALRRPSVLSSKIRRATACGRATAVTIVAAAIAVIVRRRPSPSVEQTLEMSRADGEPGDFPGVHW